ncbi:MAG: hypothetical protein EPN22_02390 [Nitrospirae bacterium]|nr:MAG: hypothetical protein EPN22_02390 [Nitrospirota bacterium]
MKYISVSDMHSKLIFLAAVVISVLAGTEPACSELLDKIVAYVDNNAITYSELKTEHARNKMVKMTEVETLNSMLNKMLLLKEARAMRLEASNNDELLKEYIEIKIRSVILIKDEDVENFYNKNKTNFGVKSLSESKDDIETYLFEAETNRLLNEHIANLRNGYEVVIRLKE